MISPSIITDLPQPQHEAALWEQVLVLPKVRLFNASQSHAHQALGAVAQSLRGSAVIVLESSVEVTALII